MDGSVAKVDADGRHVFNFNLCRDDRHDNSVDDIVMAPDGSFCVAGRFSYQPPWSGPLQPAFPLRGSGSALAYLYPKGRKDAYMAAFASDGSLKWALQAGSAKDETPPRTALSASGRAYLMGQTDTIISITTSQGDSVILDGAGILHTYLVALTDSGNIAWTRLLEGGDRNLRIAALPGNRGLVLAGSFKGTTAFGADTLAAEGYQDAFVARLNDAGNYLWARRAGGPGTDSVLSLRVDKRGYPAVAIAYDSALTEAFGGQFAPASALQRQAVFRLQASDGRAVRSLSPFWAAEAPALRAFDLSPDGSVYLGAELGGAGNFGGSSFYQTLGGNSGYPDYTPAPDVFIARLGRGDTLAAGFPVMVSTRQALPSDGLVVYPNPATDGPITVRYAKALGRVDMLTIFNSQGQVAHTQPVSGADLAAGIRLDTRLAAGLYTVRCQGKSGRVVVP